MFGNKMMCGCCGGGGVNPTGCQTECPYSTTLTLSFTISRPAGSRHPVDDPFFGSWTYPMIFDPTPDPGNGTYSWYTALESPHTDTYYKYFFCCNNVGLTFQPWYNPTTVQEEEAWFTYSLVPPTQFCPFLGHYHYETQDSIFDGYVTQ